MDNIKPCPFCSSALTARRLLDGYQTVVCVKCGAQGPMARIEENAITLWNVRSSKPQFVIEWAALPEPSLNRLPEPIEVKCTYGDCFEIAKISHYEFPLKSGLKEYIELSLKRKCAMRYTGL